MDFQTQDDIRAAVLERVAAEQADSDQAEHSGGGTQKAPELKGIGETAFPSQRVLDCLGRNEEGDAELFVELNRGRLIFDHAAGLWFTWAGHHWELDATEQALSKAGEVADIYFAEMGRQAVARIGAEKAEDSKTADAAEKLEKALSRRARDLHTVRRRQDVLHLARAGAGTLGISGDQWDADPMSLPVLNGVVDLRTGTFRDGKPEDYFRAYAPTPWEGINAPCPTWEAFLCSTFAGDGDLVTFMGRLLGYSITGKTTEAVLPILWGAGRNGKTVLLQAMADSLGGDLAGPLEGEMLLESRYKRPSGGPSSDLLHLRGKRLTWLSETNENRRLNAGKVKLLTGGDLITGRAPYAKRQITFAPTHKIFLLTNHRPKADAQDSALWHRVLLVPFGMAFLANPDPTKPNERKADKILSEKLKAERPGILAWLVRGCLLWQKEGLKPPESVRAATKEYQDGENTLKIFLQDRCTEGPGQTVRAKEFYQVYRAWAEENGERPFNGNKFGAYMGQMFDFSKDKHGKFYIGVDLR